MRHLDESNLVGYRRSGGAMSGELVTIWTVRAATLLYIAAVSLWLTARTPRGGLAARLSWSIGCLLYLAHVWCAFQFFHGWNHQAAYAETARQTGEVFGLGWGGGLYFNYLFTLVWLTDVIWWWAHEESYRRRPRWIAASIHAFMAFMFFNGAVVFASGFSRWVGLAATPMLLVLWWRGRRVNGEQR
jgi:hypothetical protein